MASCRSSASEAWDWAALRAIAYEEAWTILRDPEQANDAAQEAIVRAWRRADQCRAPEAPEPWLRAIARREALRVARGAPCAELADDAACEAEMEEKTVLRLHVATTLAALQPSDRALLQKRYWEDLSCAEIGAELGVAPATAKLRLHRARLRLRRHMERHLVRPRSGSS